MADFYTYRNEFARRRRKRRAVLVLVILLALLCAAAGWFWHQKQGTAEDTPASTATPAVTATRSSPPRPSPQRPPENPR